MSSSDYNTTTSNTNAAIKRDFGRDSEPKPASMQIDKSPQSGTVETVATNENCDNRTNNNDNLDKKDDTSMISTNHATGNIEDGKTTDASQQENDGQKDQQDESSNLSTAFTISFEDESASTSKKFGIRDSIRKFAPPKPNTIEKPRTIKSDTQDNSYTSIQSSPGALSKQSFHRTSTNNTSCRSSGRKSDSSRHSNISESAAFLIDRMLNCNQGESLSSMCLESSNKGKARSQSNRSKCGSATKKVIARSSDAILDGDAGSGDGDDNGDGADAIDDEVDFCEDKSDNGTYIVGAEHESDAARKKIDELFGVVKAAEQSIIAASKAARSTTTIGRQNPGLPIIPDRKPLNRERQEHIDRLARGRNRSPSSSSSGRDIGLTGHRARSTTRKSRNSSCDRESKLPSSKSRRAASQSSRQSSHPGLSDGDTQSSRSSLHLVETSNLDVQTANHPSMKFNRAFALRRARLGLGEPNTMNRLTSTPASYSTQEPDSSLNTSPRRAVNVSAPRYGQSGSSGQQNLGRNDGGRFSLRMKKTPLPRLGGLGSSGGRVIGQQGALIDSYINKVFTTKASSSLSNQTSPSHQNSHHTPIAMAYQSNDDLEGTNSSRYRGPTAKSSDAHPVRKTHHLSEIEGDNDYCSNRFNYSLGGVESELYTSLVDSNIRSCSSGGRQINSSGQLGALDCLVVSAISSLSVKIRTSVCDLMVEHAKRLPTGNETRSVVEEILPQLTAASSRPKSPTSIEEIDQSLHFDLAQTLKNLKKVEQIVDVMKLISNQTQTNTVNVSTSTGVHRNSRSPGLRHQTTSTKRVVDGGGDTSNGNSEANSLSPV